MKDWEIFFVHVFKTRTKSQELRFGIQKGCRIQEVLSPHLPLKSIYLFFFKKTMWTVFELSA